MASRLGPAPDTSLLISPIELGSSTIIQLMNARDTATKEVISSLEQDCDAILECRFCRSLFRSLANFIAHRRIHCQGVCKGPRTVPESTTVVNPTNADLRPPRPFSAASKTTAKNARRSIAPNKKVRAVRRTAPSDVARLTSPSVAFQQIPGVSCAISVVGVNGTVENPSSHTKDEHVTVQPKDGYPNMSLRQRGSRPVADDAGWEDIEYEEEITKISLTTSKPKPKASRAAMTKSLSRRSDCDVALMKCLTCKTTFSTPKTLNFHMLSKHSKQRKVYSCIYCDNVFTQFWGVTRHLKSAHDLKGDMIDKIREQIRASVHTETLQQDEATPNLPSTSVASASTSTKAKIKVTAGTSGTQTLLKANLAKTSTATGSKTGSNTESKAASKTELKAESKTDSKAESKTESKTDSKGESKAATAKANLCCDNCNKSFSMIQYLHLHMIACYNRSNLPPPAFKRTSSPVSVATEASKPLLFVCKSCNRAFSKRSNMERHARACSKKQSQGSASGSQGSDSHSPTEKSESSGSSEDKNLLPEMNGTEAADSEDGELVIRRHTKSLEKQGMSKLSPAKFDCDDILLQLSPSDEAKEEELALTPPVTPSSLALGRPKRKLKPKPFSDGTVRKVNAPEVVKVQQADGSQVYKLRDDVQPATDVIVSAVEEDKAAEEEGEARRGCQPSPSLDEENQAKLETIIDTKKLMCLVCSRVFRSAFNLKRHAISHLDCRRFKCKICDFTAFKKPALKAHLRRVHEEEVSTLLDGGLTPYIVDMSDSKDWIGRKTTPTTTRTRKHAKEPVVEEGEVILSKLSAHVMEENEDPSSTKPPAASKATIAVSKKTRGRPRKQQFTTATSAAFLDPTDSIIESSSTVKSTTRVTSSTDASNKLVLQTDDSKARSRPRKQQLRTVSPLENVVSIPSTSATPSPDENRKRGRPSKSCNTASVSDSGPPPQKLTKVETSEKAPVLISIQPAVSSATKPPLVVVVSPGQLKPSDSLEGLVNKLKGAVKQDHLIPTVVELVTQAPDILPVETASTTTNA